MKSIKLKVVLWLLGLLMVMGTCIAQEDTILPKWDSTVLYKLDLDVTANPVDFTLKSEPLEKNEALQSMMELEVEQTDVLNQNLSNLNQTAKDWPQSAIEAKQSVLNDYNIEPTVIDKDYSTYKMIGYFLSAIFVGFMFWRHMPKGRKLFWTKKKSTSYGVRTITGLLIIYLIIKGLMASIDGIYLWEHVDKLF